MISPKKIFPAVVAALCVLSASARKEVWLHDMDLSKADQAAGVARANMSMWRTPIVIAADTFAVGVGTHASGVMRVALDGNAFRFRAKVGVDASAPRRELEQASVEFIVENGDGGEILWRSGVMTAADKARTADVPIKGVKNLVLKVDHCGDGISGDRADWAEAVISYDGEKPYAVSRSFGKTERRTPVADARPHINAPYIYGARPGRPFLFRVPVSGSRDGFRVEAENLPAGLVIDKKTGIISGTAPAAGDYVLGIRAKNNYGSDSHPLTLRIGDKLCLTPPMGWNSWNVFGASVSDSIIRRMVDVADSLHLRDYGFEYINIDDGWQGVRAGKYKALQPNEKFPDMKALADYVHSKGFKIGIYSSPWVETFAGYPGGSADTPDGRVIDSSRRKGDYSFAAADVAQWAEWGFDFLKYDWVTNDVESTSEMASLLRDSGRDIGFSISNAAPFGLADKWAALTNSWRTTGDITDTWCSMTAIGFLQNKWQPYAGPGHWNDPDMLVVGKVGWGDGVRPTRLSPDEQYTHITLWALLAAPMLMGCDLSQIDDFTLGLLTNPEVLAVNQDMAGVQGRRVAVDLDGRCDVWARRLADGSVAVGLFNLSDNLFEVEASWSDLGLAGRYSVRDLWRRVDCGSAEGCVSAKVQPHGTEFFLLKKID